MTTTSDQQSPVVTPLAAKSIVSHDSARPSPEPRNDFERLVKDINNILGPSNGIDSIDVDVKELKSVMRNYSGPDGEWQKYAFPDLSRPYTRNLVDNCNGKSNLLILVWTPGESSPIHDHANAHCVMRVLKGSLTENIYNWPCQSADAQFECATLSTTGYASPVHTCSMSKDGSNSRLPHQLTTKQTTTFKRGEVTYMSDQLGLHRVGNPSQTEIAVSLHLYTPPNAAKHGCHIFNEQTGVKSKVQQCQFYSELGVRME